MDIWREQEGGVRSAAGRERAGFLSFVLLLKVFIGLTGTSSSQYFYFPP